MAEERLERDKSSPAYEHEDPKAIESVVMGSRTIYDLGSRITELRVSEWVGYDTR